MAVLMTTTIYNDLTAGAHTIAVSDANGCVFSTTTELLQVQAARRLLSSLQPMLPAVLIMEHSPSAL